MKARAPRSPVRHAFGGKPHLGSASQLLSTSAAHWVAALSRTQPPSLARTSQRGCMYPPGPRQELTPVHGASGRPELPIWRWVLSVRWVTQQGRPGRSPPPGDLGFMGFLVRSGNPVADRQPLPSHPCGARWPPAPGRHGAARGLPMGPAAEAHLDTPPVTARAHLHWDTGNQPATW